MAVVYGDSGNSRLPLEVLVKNYTSGQAYDILKAFNGYTNSTTLPLPTEGFIYTLENNSDPVSPPFLPDSTWMVFAPSSLKHVSRSLVDAVDKTGYSVLLADGSLVIDDDITEGGNVSVVTIDEDSPTDFFFALSTPSATLRVCLRVDGPIVATEYGPPDYGSSHSLGGLLLFAITVPLIALVTGLTALFVVVVYFSRTRCRRGPRPILNYELAELAAADQLN